MHLIKYINNKITVVFHFIATRACQKLKYDDNEVLARGTEEVKICYFGE